MSVVWVKERNNTDQSLTVDFQEGLNVDSLKKLYTIGTGTEGSTLHTSYATRNTEIRSDFISRLAIQSIDTTTLTFEKNVDKCFRYYYTDIEHISSNQMALDVWNRAIRRNGMSTRLNQPDGIILDHDVPGAESNKAFFEFVLVNGEPKVFKYAQTADVTEEQFIMKDVQFTEVLSQQCNPFPEGFVHYSSLTIEKSGSTGSITGSISRHYALTLQSLSTRPLPASYVLNVGQQVLNGINKIHSLDYSINDIKPANLYIHSNGKIHIADYGAYTALNASQLVEYTHDYLPEELHHCPVSKANDLSCLASTLLDLCDLKPTRITRNILLAHAELVKHSELKDFIVHLLEYNHC